MIELYQLEHLLAIAAHGTMTKAAEELHLSQSAVPSNGWKRSLR